MLFILHVWESSTFPCLCSLGALQTATKWLTGSSWVAMWKWGVTTCPSCWASCPPALTPHCNQSLPAPRLDWGSYLEGLRDLLALKFLMQLQNFSAIREIVTDVSSWRIVNAFYSFYTASLTLRSHRPIFLTDFIGTWVSVSIVDIMSSYLEFLCSLNCVS